MSDESTVNRRKTGLSQIEALHRFREKRALDNYLRARERQRLIQDEIAKHQRNIDQLLSAKKRIFKAYEKNGNSKLASVDELQKLRHALYLVDYDVEKFQYFRDEAAEQLALLEKELQDARLAWCGIKERQRKNKDLLAGFTQELNGFAESRAEDEVEEMYTLRASHD